MDPIGRVIAGSSAGASLSADGGDSWVSINTGLTTLDVRSLGVDNTGKVYAGTAGGGVFELQIPVSIPEVAGAAFRVDQNVPNPCTARTEATVSLANAAPVAITVRDAQGRQMGMWPISGKGDHVITWDVSGWADGVYSYSVEGAEGRVVRRMLVAH